eukprot:TRINITY_DN3050_c0_g2_i1.p1 TRINITY_DN3050_c0_g2~~TRINITY_DN3050_c0_g2_i1.p1  ORF type:complete len:450 (+),score=54.32 TRINITY_DN3050_c0_g2_i1:133-1482(+)
MEPHNTGVFGSTFWEAIERLNVPGPERAQLKEECLTILQLAATRNGEEVKAALHMMRMLLQESSSLYNFKRSIRFLSKLLADEPTTPAPDGRIGTPFENIDAFYYRHSKKALVHVAWKNPLPRPSLVAGLDHRCDDCNEKIAAGYQAIDYKEDRDTRTYTPGRVGLDICVACATKHMDRRWRELERQIAETRGLPPHTDITLVPAEALDIEFEVSVEAGVMRGEQVPKMLLSSLDEIFVHTLDLEVCVRGPIGFDVAICISPAFLFDAQLDAADEDDLEQEANLALPLSWFPRQMLRHDAIYSCGLQYTSLCAEESEKPDEENDETCCICMDSLCFGVNRLPIRTKCGHSFHTHCLTSYCETSEASNRTPTCPVCRKFDPLEEVTHHSHPVTARFKFFKDSLDEPLQANRGYVVLGLLCRDQHHPVDSAIRAAALSYRRSSRVLDGVRL